MNEIWKPVSNYEGFYEVSNLGNVRSLTDCNGRQRFKRIRLLKPAKMRDGYLRVTFCINQETRQIPVHRLVLITFTKDNPDLQVNHINGIKDDNKLRNLEWCTRSENMLHAYRIGLEKPCDNGFKKSVSLVKDGVALQTYVSIREMCRTENLDRRAVQRVIAGKFTNHKGFTFKIN